MAPDIVDLTGDEGPEESTKHFIDSRRQVDRTTPQSHDGQSKIMPTSPAREEPATFDKLTPSPLPLPQATNPSDPRTPLRRSPTQSWDKSVPLSLKAFSRGLERIDPLLRSPISRRSYGLDSGLGESISGSDRSSQEHPGVASAAKSFIDVHSSLERAKVLKARALANTANLPQNSTLNRARSCSDKPRKSESYAFANLSAGIKRKRGSENALTLPPNELQSSPNIPLELDEISESRSLPSANLSSNHMSRRVTSITPYLPVSQKSATRSQEDASHRESSSDAKSSQQRALKDRQSRQRATSSETNAIINGEHLSTEKPSSHKSRLAPSEVAATAKVVPLDTPNASISSARIPIHSASPHYLDRDSNTIPSSTLVGFQTSAAKQVTDAQLSSPQKLPPPSKSLASQGPLPPEVALPLQATSLPQRPTPPSSNIPLPNLQPITFQNTLDNASSPKTSPMRAPKASTLHSPNDASGEGEVEMRFDAYNERSFPPGYDRGRFPMQRRRRGGKKHATPRIGTSTKHTPIMSNLHAHPPTGEQTDSLSANAQNGSHSFGELYLASRASKGKNPSAPLPSPSNHLPHANDPASELLIGATTMTEHERHNQNSAWSSLGNERVAEFYFAMLGPAIKRIKKRYRHLLSEAELDEVGKSLSEDLVTNNLIDFLRDNDFTTDKPQRKKIRKQIGHLYNDKVNLALHRRRGKIMFPPDKEVTMFWSIIPPKTISSASPLIEDTDHPTHGDLHSQSGESVASFSLDSNIYEAATPEISRDDIGFHAHHSIPKRSSNHLPNQPFDPSLPQAIVHRISSDDASNTHKDRTLDKKDQQSFEPVRLAKESRRLGDSSLPNSGYHPPKLTAKVDSKDSGGSVGEFTHEPHLYRHPQTSIDPELERLIAEAALAPPPLITKENLNQKITGEDQLLLLKKKYVAKPFSHQLSRLTAVQSRVIDPSARPERQLPALIRHRELGTCHRVPSQRELQLCSLERLEPWRKWKGASSDIVTVQWAPDSLTYAAGAAAHTNAEDLQYNRPCNLMLGELTSNLLWELPDHRTKRPAPSTIGQGYNSIQETYNACDPMVYQTVNSIVFSLDGDQMYTASRDHTVKVWDTSNGQKTCINTLNHGSVVASVDAAHVSNMRIFATASQSIKDSVRVYYGANNDVLRFTSFSSSRAELRPSLRILPECIRWGPTPQNYHLLLAGFSQWDKLGPAEWAKEGQLCIWDMNAIQSLKITPSSQSVTTVTWHPTLPFFATGGAPGGSLQSKRQATKTVVRTYDIRCLTRYAMEYESTALDIQDITFHPLNTNIVTAGCTDGTSFVWDYRWPEKPLHRLCHGDALMELDHAKPREEVDTGVLLSLWGPAGSLYYSGSSDGVVKSWDVRRHPLDAHVRDVAYVGAAIQDGAFSPDFTHLLVGDAAGGLNILSSAPCGPPFGDDSEDDCPIAASIQLVRAPDGSGKRLDLSDDNPGTEGVETAKHFLASGQLEMHPVYGAGKGPNYQGPYVKDERRGEQDDGSLGHLSEDVEKLQVFDGRGRLNELQAAFRKAYAERRKWEFYDRMMNSMPTLNQTFYANRSAKTTESREAQAMTETLGLSSASGRQPEGIAKDVMVKAQARRTADKEDMKGAIDNKIPEGEMVEENFWWSRMGEDEILKALRGI